jgi:hypothetical protein
MTIDVRRLAISSSALVQKTPLLHLTEWVRRQFPVRELLEALADVEVPLFVDQEAGIHVAKGLRYPGQTCRCSTVRRLVLPGG